MIKLLDVHHEISVRTCTDYAIETFLWELLLARPSEANISHKQMPSWEEHCVFCLSRPYRGWYLIADGEQWVGSIYLTNAGEIGLHLLPGYRRKGYGGQAIDQLIGTFGPGRYLANVAPANLASQEFFHKRGFRRIQATYELMVP